MSKWLDVSCCNFVFLEGLRYTGDKRKELVLER